MNMRARNPLLVDTSINIKPLISLARSISSDGEAFLQLLLGVCNKTAFNRIIRCPTYPVKIVTPDLEDRLQLLYESVASDPYDVSYALAFLYESAMKKEPRKKKGQFFTPAYIAKKAINSLTPRREETWLDPGCGTGIFPLEILRELRKETAHDAPFKYLGVENDPLLALSTAVSLDWVDAPSNWKILYANYPKIKYNSIEEIMGKGTKIDAIICNPPFIRYHDLSEKDELATELGLQRSSGLHSYFLQRSSELVGHGRMLFILPIEMNGTRYGTIQLENLKNKFSLVNEIIYFDEKNCTWKSLTSNKIPLRMHVQMKHVWNIILFQAILKEKGTQNTKQATSIKKASVLLGDIASVHRGISTGANNFFVITDSLAKEIGISEDMGYLKKVIPTKIPKVMLKKVFDEDDWSILKEEGRPCWLLSLPRKTPISDLPVGVRQYLRKGESLGIHLIPTCRAREQAHMPWYYIKMPRIPDLFFTYISRGYPIFVYNKIRAYNLTNLLGVYIKKQVSLDDEMERLVTLLNEELRSWIDKENVGRIYKGGLIKFEPKDLEKMPISLSSLNKHSISFKPLVLNYS